MFFNYCIDYWLSGTFAQPSAIPELTDSATDLIVCYLSKILGDSEILLCEGETMKLAGEAKLFVDTTVLGVKI